MEEKDRDRLSNEWVTVCALRQVIHVAKRGRKGKEQTTYRKALALAEAMLPEFFAPERRILEGAPETTNVRTYRQLAKLESLATNNFISAYEYASREHAKLVREIEIGEDAKIDVGLAQNKLDQIAIVMNELKPRMYSEHKMIFGDVLQVERNLPVSGEGRDYKQYALDQDRALRIRVLHPDTAEYKTGADLFYEHLDEEKKRARLAIVQFKIWDGKSFHQDDRMMEQIARMEKFSCGNGLCNLSDDRRRSYRLPPCAAFLRPTDRLQEPDSKMHSSGNHIPLCVVKNAWELNKNGGKSVRKHSIEDRSLSPEVFEELFNTKMLGGKELSYDDLNQLYNKFGLFDYSDTIQVHAQEFTMTEESEDAKGEAKKRATRRKKGGSSKRKAS